jgi:NAD-dependent deacetylase
MGTRAGQPLDDVMDIVRRCIAQARHVCVLTGAGVSAESGIATFRDPDGIWARFSPKELASMDGFMSNPDRVREWYAHRRSIAESARPNAGHVALAALQDVVPVCTIVTQNVDRLHQRAGSRTVLEVHGNLIENRCNDCSARRTDDEADCPDCGGLMRPNVVWFGEDLPMEVFLAAEEACRTCDVLLVVGTSAEVYPAASLPYKALQAGVTVVEINPNQTAFTPRATFVIQGTSAQILPRLVPEAA